MKGPGLESAVARRAVTVTAAMSLGAVAMLGAVRAGASPWLGLAGGVIGAWVTMFGLRTLAIRTAAFAVLGASVLVLLRLPPTTGGSTSSYLALWVVGTGATLVLVHRLQVDSRLPLAAGARPVPSPILPSSEPAVPWLAENARLLGLAGVAIVMLAALLAPALTRSLQSRAAGSGSGSGEGGRNGGQSSASLRSTHQLDTTVRPSLGNKVLMTVRSDRGAFWRGETFDQWDGSRWTRSVQPVAPVLANAGTGAVVADPDEPPLIGGQELRQTFTMAAFSNVIFAAPSAVRVEANTDVLQRRDATLLTSGVSVGASYTVASRRVPVTAERLRAAPASTSTAPSAVPARVRATFAAPPVATERVRRLARSITAGAPTTYDKVVAIEGWMGAHTKYSIKAPTSPHGVDAVDHFLFQSQRGWCEQVASSEVVMLRALGVPARLVSGFVPDQHDVITGTFTVRERDAHAWTEVYFPGVGWQDFDPTASVPLAGDSQATNSVTGWLRSHALLLLLLAGALVVGRMLVWLLGRRRRTTGGGKGRRRTKATWAQTRLLALERLGRRAGRSRMPWETATAYATTLGAEVDEPRLAPVGRLLDAESFGALMAGPDQRARVDEVLRDLRRRFGRRGGRRHRRLLPVRSRRASVPR